MTNTLIRVDEALDELLAEHAPPGTKWVVVVNPQEFMHDQAVGRAYGPFESFREGFDWAEAHDEPAEVYPLFSPENV